MKQNKLLLFLAIIVVAVASIRVALRTWPWIPTVLPLVTNGGEDTGKEDEPEDLKTNGNALAVGKTVPFEVTFPKNFNMGIFAEGLGAPRVLLFDARGRLLVSIPSQGKVISLFDTDGDGYAESKDTILSGLQRPHGLAFYERWLYVAETDKIVRYEYDIESGKIESRGEKLLDLPSGGRHFTRTIGFNPEGRLFISIGSSCDTCLEDDERRAAMMVADSDGKNARVYASGLRNSVFFRWQPETQKLFATDMGRDFLGDNLPPDEVNVIEEKRGYGWPFCYGKKVYDTVFRGVDNCAHSEPSLIDLPAHVAPLGLAFGSKEWGRDWDGDLLIAYHGSWNSSVPVGYKVVRFTKESDYQDGDDLITGFLSGDTVHGRPVDLLFDSRGRLFISDDKRGVIYTVAVSK